MSGELWAVSAYVFVMMLIVAIVAYIDEQKRFK